MLFTRYFKTSRSLDENQERNLLFAPTYLLREYELKNGKQLVFGGHSIINIEESEDNTKGLYFLRTRASKSNKLEEHGAQALLLGFHSLNQDNFLTLGTREEAAKAKSGDRLILRFQDKSAVSFKIQNGNTENADNLKQYACNFKVRLGDSEIKKFTDSSLEGFELIDASTNKSILGEFSMEYSRKFREVAQTYKFCLDQYYMTSLSSWEKEFFLRKAL